MKTHTVIDSPIGELTLVATGGTLSGVYLQQQRHLPSRDTFGEPDDGGFDKTAHQLTEYFEGRLTRFDVPFTFHGTEFQRRVWTELSEIPYGETISYRELAQRLGNPAASRAVGLANGKNPISIIVPCHRVVGSNGDLTGYGGGIERKRFLLDFERGSGASVLF